MKIRIIICIILLKLNKRENSRDLWLACAGLFMNLIYFLHKMIWYQVEPVKNPLLVSGVFPMMNTETFSLGFVILVANYYWWPVLPVTSNSLFSSSDAYKAWNRQILKSFWANIEPRKDVWSIWLCWRWCCVFQAPSINSLGGICCKSGHCVHHDDFCHGTAQIKPA